MNRPQSDGPIGVFDSGIGGLTVFREIIRVLPHEDIIYLGDTARLPYGSKSADAIVRYSLNSASFLLSQGIKMLIVACYTASTHALEILQEKLPIPVIGVVQPGFELIMKTTQKQRIAILGTQSTIASNIYQNLIRQHYPKAQVFAIACPLFVPLAEENFSGHEAARLIADHYLSSLKTADIDAVLLACTHYPLLRKAIQQALPPNIAIIDSGPYCAEQARNLLTASHLLKEPHVPEYCFYVTDHPSHFATLAKLFLGREIDLRLIQIESST